MPKKKIKKKIVKKTVLAKPIGTVTHFYGGLKVGIIKFNKPVKVGATIRFKGATTDFSQKIASMQYDHKPLKIAPKGKQVGLKIKKRVRVGDKVYA